VANLAWSDELSVGVSALDDDHQELFDGLEALKVAMSETSDPGVHGAALSRLAESTRAHFSHEEEMMKAVKYPGQALHAASHQHLTEKLGAFVARHCRGGHAMNEHSLKFLNDWLIHHIQTDDLRFGLWLKECVAKRKLDNAAKASATPR